MPIARLFRFLTLALLAWLPQSAWAAVPMASAGIEYGLALKADGSVTAWGRNDEGQLGDGQGAYSAAPKKVAGIGPVAAMAAGVGFTVALDRAGGLWAWGLNGSGELADGTTQSRYIPRRITNIGGTVTAVAAGNGHALALTSDGRVWAWGATLGGSGTISLAPQIVAGLPTIRAIEAGAFHALARAADGSVWAWGSNDYGQLGNGTKASSSAPMKVSGLSGITMISTGYYHNLAIDGSGQVWSWGNNVYGTIGIGTLSPRQVTTPVALGGLPKITSVSAGNVSSAAIDADGGVWMWGAQAYGMNVYGPRAVTELTGLGIVEIRSGWYHLIARDRSGKVWGWGRNESGYIGNGDTAYQKTAVAALGVSGAVALAAQMHSLALDADGTLWAWGMSGNGELGDGTPAIANLPVKTLGLSNIFAVAAGGYHSLALGNDGRAWAWGANHNGQLGDETTVPRRTPAAISSLSDIVGIAAGTNHSLALDWYGQVWSWGLVNDGQLGRSGNPWLPGLVAGLPEIVAIAAGYAHSLALGADGSVWAWGANESGQLGDGSRTTRLTPVRVANLGAIVAIDGGSAHSLALDAYGAAWAWGGNTFGQLGNGTATDRATPAKVAGLPGIKAIAAGGGHNAALASDGRLWTWGSNREGQLGRAATAGGTAQPAMLDDLQDIATISAGDSHTLALRGDGTAWAAGRNFSGALGDGTLAQRDRLTLALDSGGDAALDLDPAAANQIPTGKLPPLLARASRIGDLTALSLSVALDGRVLSSSGSVSGQGFSAACAPCEVYVAAIYNGALLLANESRNWMTPLPEQISNNALPAFLRGVQISTQARLTVDILQQVDVSGLPGASILIGYGSSAQEMLAAGRYYPVFTVPER